MLHHQTRMLHPVVGMHLPLRRWPTVPARPLYNYCLGGATLYQSPGRSKSSTYSLGYVPSAIRWTSRTTRSSMCSPTSAASKPPRSNSCGATRRRRLGSFKVIVFVDSGCVRSVPSFPGYPKRWPDWWDRTEAQMRAALHDCRRESVATAPSLTAKWVGWVRGAHAFVLRKGTHIRLV